MQDSAPTHETPPAPPARLWRLPAVLILSTLLLAIPYFHASPRWVSPQYQLFWWFALSFACLFVVPCIVVIAVWREGLAAYGLGLGRPGIWLRYGAVYALVVLPALVAASRLESIQQFYPRYQWARHSVAAFVLSEAGWLFYFLAWEFFFRGFLLFTLLRELPPATAIAMQTVPFAMMHFPKPEIEALASIVAGVALGWMAYRGKSMLGTWLLHFVCAATVDALVVFWRPA